MADLYRKTRKALRKIRKTKMKGQVAKLYVKLQHPFRRGR